jgi:hypothetical protein
VKYIKKLNIGDEQNNGSTKKLRNRTCVDCIERTSAGNTECSSSVGSQSMVLGQCINDYVE